MDLNKVRFLYNTLIQSEDEGIALIKSNKYSINELRIILEKACECNYYNTVKYLIGIISPIYLSLFTPLHYASLKGHIDIVQLLLDNNIDVDIKNSIGMTALHVACNREIAELLIRHGADIYHKDNINNTILHTSCAYRLYDSIIYFIELGIDINAMNAFGDTALHETTKNSQLKIVSILLDNNADVNIGHSPFLDACFYGHINIVSCFLDKVITKKELNSKKYLEVVCERYEYNFHDIKKREKYKDIAVMLITHGTRIGSISLDNILFQEIIKSREESIEFVKEVSLATGLLFDISNVVFDYKYIYFDDIHNDMAAEALKTVNL